VLELSLGGNMDALDNKQPLQFFGSRIEYSTIENIVTYVMALVIGIVQQEYAT
jgi:hypothetical protein